MKLWVALMVALMKLSFLLGAASAAGVVPADISKAAERLTSTLKKIPKVEFDRVAARVRERAKPPRTTRSLADPPSITPKAGWDVRDSLLLLFCHLFMIAY